MLALEYKTHRRLETVTARLTKASHYHYSSRKGVGHRLWAFNALRRNCRHSCDWCILSRSQRAQRKLSLACCVENRLAQVYNHNRLLIWVLSHTSFFLTFRKLLIATNSLPEAALLRASRDLTYIWEKLLSPFEPCAQNLVCFSNLLPFWGMRGARGQGGLAEPSHTPACTQLWRDDLCWTLYHWTHNAALDIEAAWCNHVT